MKHAETYACTTTRGPRPAGQPDQCFYCPAAVGDDHEPGCVLRLRTVVLEVTTLVVVAVPEDWTEENILFSRNESSRCADNTIADLGARLDDRCACADTSVRFVREATEQDEQVWDVASMVKD